MTPTQRSLTGPSCSTPNNRTKTADGTSLTTREPCSDPEEHQWGQEICRSAARRLALAAPCHPRRPAGLDQQPHLGAPARKSTDRPRGPAAAATMAAMRPFRLVASVLSAGV